MTRGYFATLGIFALSGCMGPTAATPITEPSQIRLTELTACYAEVLNVPYHIKVGFFEEERSTPEDALCTKDCTMVTPAGLANIPSHMVLYWAVWARKATDAELRWVAAHEVCHIGMVSYDEQKVQTCAQLIYGECE